MKLKTDDTTASEFITLGQYAETLDNNLNTVSLAEADQIKDIARQMSSEDGLPVKTTTGRGIRKGRVAERFHISVIEKAFNKFLKNQ